MIRLLLLILSLVVFALLALNGALKIDTFTEFPIQWLAGGFALFVAANLPLDRPVTSS